MKAWILIPLLLVLLAPSIFAGGCHYFKNNNGLDLKVGFDTPFVKIPVANPNKLVYAVPEGAKLLLTDIRTYVDQCTDGDDKEIFAPIRVVEINPDGVTTKPFLNGYSSGGAKSCDGGSIIHGTGDINSIPFAASGTFNFRIEYSEISNGSVWKTYKDLEIRVNPGALEVIPAIGTSIGMQKNIYENETEKQAEFLWEVKNVGGVDVELLDVNFTDGFCNNQNITSCTFPANCTNCFRRNMVLRANETAFIKELVTVKRPGKSPTADKLSINVRYRDYPIGMKTDDTTKKIEAVNVPMNFTVVGAAIAPFEKEGEFEVEPNTTYHMQICTDSVPTDIYGVPAHSMEVFDAAGVLVAERTFHTVAFPNTSGRCTDPNTLRTYNQNIVENGIEGGLYKIFTTGNFPAGEKQRYKWKISGIVGVNDDMTGSNYRSDFARISKWFNQCTQLVSDRPGPENCNNLPQTPAGPVSQQTGFIVDTSLGPQGLSKVLSGLQTQSINIFDGTKKIFTFKPEIAQNPVPGPVFFGFTSAGFDYDGSDFSYSGFKQTAIQDDKSEIFFVQSSDPEDGKPMMSVFARTSVLRRTEGNPPVTDVNLLWLDREKYMVELRVGAAGVCRDLQNAVISNGASSAFGGSEVAPKVKYDWRPRSVAINECSPGNANYSVCDSTQFSYVLLRKLNVINNLLKAGKSNLIPLEADFNVFMMADGFSSDFRNDFDFYYKDKFLESDDLNYATIEGDSAEKWDKYFKDEAKLVFNPSLVREPGLYDVRLVLRFGSDEGNLTSKDTQFFDEQGNPIAKIEVIFKKNNSVSVPANVLYYLPIDAELGKREGVIQRSGYGVGFKPVSNDKVFFVFNTGNSQDIDFSVQTSRISADSAPLAFVEVNKVDSFVDLSKTNPGQLLLISKKDLPLGTTPEYVLTFAPSLPVPMAISAENSGGIIASEYRIKENGQSIEAGDYLARLVEIAAVKNNTYSCLDDTTSNDYPLPAFVRTDRQRQSSIASCKLVSGISNLASIYGVSRETQSDKSLLFETVLYAPTSGKEISVLNLCESQGKIYVPEYNEKAEIVNFHELAGSGPELALSRPPQSITTLGHVIEKIRQGQACLAYSTQSVGSQLLPNNVGVWWNESKVVEEFRNQLDSKGIEANFCFG